MRQRYNRRGEPVMFYAYPIISLFYLTLPVLAAGVMLSPARRHGRARRVRVFLRTCATGAFLGGAVALFYTSAAGAQVPFTQMALACYLGISTLCIVSGLNWMLFQGVSRAFRINPRTGQGGSRRRTQVAAGILQAVLLIVVGLPFLGSVLVLYRPKVPSAGNPLTLIEAPFQTVGLRASDGTPLAGWWIPATRNRFTDGRGSVKWGHDTVLLCHGFGGDKAGDLFLARDLVANGYNVLAIDLRAHGRSGGQFTGFGGIESRDVLGAVHWLRVSHPGQCHRILGLGESLGAVALIEAAADPGPDGQAIDAIAAYNPYAELSTVIGDAAEQHVIPAGRWLLKHAILPVASAQIGSDLAHVSPARAVQALWPRPILVLGNPTSRSILGGQSFDLYQNTMQPKYSYWRDDAGRDTLLHDETAALTVRIFFDEEQSIL